MLKRRLEGEEVKIFSLEGKVSRKLTIKVITSKSNRTKDDEQEEIRIKEEIKAIDALLKKNKKQVTSFQ